MTGNFGAVRKRDTGTDMRDAGKHRTDRMIPEKRGGAEPGKGRPPRSAGEIPEKRVITAESANGVTKRAPRETPKPEKPGSGNAMQEIRPTVWIGKSGMTASVLGEITGQLATRAVVKVKWLRNIGVEPAAIAEKTGSILVSVRGRTMVLARRKRPADRGR